MLKYAIGFLKQGNYIFEENIDLSTISTVRIGPKAPIVVYPTSVDQLSDLIALLKQLGIRYFIIGRLSNVLICGDRYDGVIISLKRFDTIKLDRNILEVGAGSSLSQTLSYASRRGIGGAEQLWLIPGSIGASVIGNAGAHGLEMSDVLLSVTVFDSNGSVKVLKKEDLFPSYRSTSLKGGAEIVLNVKIKLQEKPLEEIRKDLAAYKLLRKESQPLNFPSLGSVFKRISGVSAGYYIDQAGLKGFRIGGAGISEKHAGFFVNLGGATYLDYLNLIDHTKETVLRRFGIILEEEIIIVK